MDKQSFIYCEDWGSDIRMGYRLKEERSFRQRHIMAISDCITSLRVQSSPFLSLSNGPAFVVSGTPAKRSPSVSYCCSPGRPTWLRVDVELFWLLIRILSQASSPDSWDRATSIPTTGIFNIPRGRNPCIRRAACIAWRLNCLLAWWPNFYSIHQNSLIPCHSAHFKYFKFLESF